MPMDPNCVRCNARCCRYFCVPLGVPGDEEDLDTARWYLLHEGTSVFIDRDGEWWVRIDNRCRMLRDTPRGPRCLDYKGRPLVCRRFSPKACEYTLGGWGYAELFRTPKDLEAWARRHFDQPAARRRKPRST